MTFDSISGKLRSSSRKRVNAGDAVDGGVDLSGSALSLRDGLLLRAKEYQGVRSGKDGYEDIDHNANSGFTVKDERRAEVERCEHESAWQKGFEPWSVPKP